MVGYKLIIYSYFRTHLANIFPLSAILPKKHLKNENKIFSYFNFTNIF